MNEYRIGALSQLISCNPDEKDGEIDYQIDDDLFKASPAEEVQIEKVDASVQPPDKSPKKKKKHSKKDNTNETIENEVKTENDDSAQDKSLKKTKKKSKKVSVEDKDDSEDDDLSVKYNQPSSKFRVRHEEENRTKPRDEDKEKRTIFIGNLPINATKKQIKSLLRECGEIETIRFRGAARPDMSTTKKQAIIQRKFHEKRHNIIAYARFKDVEDAQKSLKLDGHKVGEQTIRIDLASKDDTSQNRDQSKAIFVGNLGFATGEDEVREHFSQCGKIANVRIVRDSQTGIGKGFCYVNFASSESVKTALDLMSKTTLCGRELRISQSVSRPKKTLTMVPKTPKSGAFPSKKPNLDRFKKSQAKVVKVKKNVTKSFVGQKAADFSTSIKNNDKETKKKSKKKPSQGERKRKMIAKHLLP